MPENGLTPRERSSGTGARILFLYPNERGMSTVPAAIATLVLEHKYLHPERYLGGN